MVLTQAKRLKLNQLKAQIDQLKSTVETSNSSSAQVSQQILAAIHELKATDYREAYQRFVDLKDRARELTLRKELLSRLEQDAPAWATDIFQRKGQHGLGTLPGNPAEGLVMATICG